MSRNKILSHLGLIIVVILWGIAPVVSKYLFDNNFYSPALLVAARGLLSIVVGAIFIAITGGFKEVNKSYLICIPAGVILGCAYLFQFIGLESTTPAKNTFLESLSCIAVPICMFLLVREKPSIVAIISSIVCLIGAFVLCGKGLDFSEMFTAPTIGDILSAIGGVFFGIDIAFTKVFAKGKNPWVYVFFQLVILTVMAFVYAIPFEKNIVFSWAFPNLMILVFLGVICTAVCWVLRTISIRNVSAVTCAVLMPMAAVIATFISIIFRVEEFSWNVVIGGIIITLAIVLSGIYDARMEQKQLFLERTNQEVIIIMSKIQVNSEIGKLKTVLLHEPGEELHNLTPKHLDDLLFDDIPWLPLAKKEHKKFAQTFIDNGVKVVYLTDLVTEALDTSNEVKEMFIHQFVKEANINSITLSQVVTDYLLAMEDTKQMVLKAIAGIKKNELPNYQKRTLRDMVDDKSFATDPMPNLYFQRDPFASVGNMISLNNMYSVTRSRETIFGEYIFKYHPEYKNTHLIYHRDEVKSIEGGDIMVLNNKTLIVGSSQRTTPVAIENLAKNIFFKEESKFETIIVLFIPKARTFMHLDTIFTQVDINKFTIHKECYEELKIIEIKKGDKKLIVNELDEKLKEVLERYLKQEVILIPCGGEDIISAQREQWSDGSNTIAIAPGKVIAYERNDITNNILRSYGVEVFEIPSSELSRGRGGPRCMCMPLEREDI